jgi:CBS domain-containing protein
MVHLRVRHLPVVDANGLAGVVTDANLFQHGTFVGEPGPDSRVAEFVAYDEADEQLTAGDLAIQPVVVCRPDDPLEPVVRRIAKSTQDFAVVIDDHKHPVGILTEHDTTRLALAILPKVQLSDGLALRAPVTFPEGTPERTCSTTCRAGGSATGWWSRARAGSPASSACATW